MDSSSNKEGQSRSSTLGSMNEANCCMKTVSAAASEAASKATFCHCSGTPKTRCADGCFLSQCCLCHQYGNQGLIHSSQVECHQQHKCLKQQCFVREGKDESAKDHKDGCGLLRVCRQPGRLQLI